MRSLIAGILALILPMTECAGIASSEQTPTEAATTTPTTESPPDDADFASTLENFDDCDALLAHIRAEALSRVGPYGLDGDRFGPVFGARAVAEEAAEADFAVAESAAAAPAAVSGDDGGAGGPDFSGTNVQVTGVDEPDIVKTDGRRIITVRNGTLTVIDVTGAEPTITGRVLLGERWGGELLLHGDRVLVINNHYGTIQPLAADARIGGYSRDIVIIDEILLDGTPRRGRSLHTEGRYVSSRSIDGTARVVVVSYPSELAFVYPRNPKGEPIADLCQPQGRGGEHAGGLAAGLPGGLLGGHGHRGGPDPGLRPGVRAVAVLRLRVTGGADLRPQRVADAR